MKVEPEETATSRDILLAHGTEKGTFATAGFAEDRDMHRATRWAQNCRPACGSIIGHLMTERKPRDFLPCIASPVANAVPERAQEMFEEVCHFELILKGTKTELVTASRRLQDGYADFEWVRCQKIPRKDS
jgi:alpha/beta superfamily hydrolase